jgi:hypothetical protein
MKQMTRINHDNTTQKNDSNRKSELKTYGSKANLHVITLWKFKSMGSTKCDNFEIDQLWQYQ